MKENYVKYLVWSFFVCFFTLFCGVVSLLAYVIECRLCWTRSFLDCSIWTQTLENVFGVSGTTSSNCRERLSPPYLCINICTVRHKQNKQRLREWQPVFKASNHFYTSYLCSFISVSNEYEDTSWEIMWPISPPPQHRYGADSTSDLSSRISSQSCSRTKVHPLPPHYHVNTHISLAIAHLRDFDTALSITIR